MTIIPTEYRAAVFRLNCWLRFKQVEQITRTLAEKKNA